MQRKVKIFMNNRSQAVRLPKEFQFKTREIYIRKVKRRGPVVAAAGLVILLGRSPCGL